MVMKPKGDFSLLVKKLCLVESCQKIFDQMSY